MIRTRLMIINRRLDFAVTAKKALEQLGGYEVAPFTTPDTALDYLRLRPHDVVMVDFTLKGLSGSEIIRRIRELQPDIALIANPKNAETLAAMSDLQLQDVIDTPLPIRQLIPILQQAVRHAQEQLLPDTVEAPSFSESALGIALLSSESAFARLAEEEPPLPSLEEGGTIRDLRPVDSAIQEVVEILQEPIVLEEPQPLPVDEGSGAILARQILEDISDHRVELTPEFSPEAPTLEQIGRLATELTQASLELTTEATILTQNDQIIAHAGKLIAEEIAEIHRLIDGDWQASEGQSRIRFVNLPTTGKDYLLFSRRTEADFTLTMVFLGNMPLRVIRKQSEKLLQALTLVPEESMPTAEAESPTPILESASLIHSAPPPTIEFESLDHPAEPDAIVAFTGSLIPYTFIWLLRDPDAVLDNRVAQAIITGLDQQLTQRHWQIHTLRVHEDYVYLYANVPDDRPIPDQITDLKGLAAEIAATRAEHLNPHGLWADSYFALTPGRDLETPEIQRFIRFAR
ncbi:MAG: transposase [Anaerolineae bacterium]|nr:transposase [Anaerolineae bacterium]